MKLCHLYPDFTVPYQGEALKLKFEIDNDCLRVIGMSDYIMINLGFYEVIFFGNVCEPYDDAFYEDHSSIVEKYDLKNCMWFVPTHSSYRLPCTFFDKVI